MRYYYLTHARMAVTKKTKNNKCWWGCGEKGTPVHCWLVFTQSCPNLWPHGLQHTSLPCPSPSLEACSSLHSLSQWCHPAISSSVVPFSSCLQSFLERIFSKESTLSISGESIGASASTVVLPMNIQDWFPLRLTGRNVNCGSHYGKQYRRSSKN